MAGNTIGHKQNMAATQLVTKNMAETQGEQEYPLDIWSSDKGSGHRIVILSPHWWNVIWSLIGREL